MTTTELPSLLGVGTLQRSRASQSWSLPALGGTDLGGDDAKVKSPGRNAQAELLAARADIKREVLRSVPPFSFSGRHMRFQDECAVLEIFADGRFRYATFSTKATHLLDVTCREPGPNCRPALRYEGVCVAPKKGSCMGSDAAPGKETTGVVEGRALVCSEGVEGGARGPERVLSVRRGVVRFGITVVPIVQPESATVQFLERKDLRVGGHHQPQVWTLPYVGSHQHTCPSSTPRGMQHRTRCRRHRQKAALLT